MDPLLLTLFEVKPRKGDLRKLEIVRAALKTLADLGYEETNYESIAKGLGIRRSHVSYYFKSKDEILVAAVTFALRKGYEYIVQYLQEAKGPARQLEAWVAANFRWTGRHPEYAAALLLLFDLGHRNEDYRLLLREVVDGGRKRLGLILKQLKPNIDSKTIRQAHTLLVGHVLLMCGLEGKRKDPTDYEQLTLAGIRRLL